MGNGFLFLVAVSMVQAQSLVPGRIAFEDIAQRAQVRFVADNSATPKKHQPEPMVAGVALLDYDGDGYLDIYFVNGAAMPSLIKDGGRHANRLFRNNGNLTFTDVTVKAGAAGSGYGMGVAAADYDNDGHPDLFIANVNENQLFHNNGDGTFSDVTARARVAGGLFQGRKMWSVSAAWLDYDRDGRLDLFVSNYCRWDPATEQPCIVNGHRISCNPRYYEPLPHTLYRNNGDGTFADVSAPTGISPHLGRGMGVAVADYDDDGWPDIFVANDDSPNQLFHNLGGKRFEEVALDAGVALPEGGNVVSGMGADFRDYMNDGRPSIWHTAVEQQTFPLFRNLGSGNFVERTNESGLALESLQMSGWGNGIFDLDNDGWKDLFAARSNVTDNIALFSRRRHPEPNAVFRNLGKGRFQNVSASAGLSFQSEAVHRGVAFGDLDNDGRVDAVVSVLNGPARVFRNTSPDAGHWLLLHLAGSRSNRDAIGARIRVTTPDGAVQYNHVTTSTGYACSSDVRVHFGLGPHARAREIEIAWPSGARQVLRDVAADRIVRAAEPPLN